VRGRVSKSGAFNGPSFGLAGKTLNPSYIWYMTVANAHGVMIYMHIVVFYCMGGGRFHVVAVPTGLCGLCGSVL
jgi:hypothetical protein